RLHSAFGYGGFPWPPGSDSRSRQNAGPSDQPECCAALSAMPGLRANPYLTGHRADRTSESVVDGPTNLCSVTASKNRAKNLTGGRHRRNLPVLAPSRPTIRPTVFDGAGEWLSSMTAKTMNSRPNPLGENRV